MAQQPEKNMFRHGIPRRFVIVFACVALLLVSLTATVALRVQSAIAIDAERDCSITVSMPQDYQELPGGPAKLVFDVYQVASITVPTGVDAYVFSPVEALEGSSINWGELGSSESYDALAQLACSKVLGSDVPEAERLTLKKSAYVGDAAEELKPGLYLIIVHGEDLSAEEYTRVSSEGVYSTIGTSPYYEFTFRPELIAVPSKEGADGTLSTMGPGDWDYDVSATLKTGRTDRYGSIAISKELLSYETSSVADFVFQVDAYEDQEGLNNNDRTKLTYSNVFNMSFSQAGQQSIVLEGLIPAGSYVRVTEVYSGASYVIQGDAEQTFGPIPADPLGGLNGQVADEYVAQFVNDYNDRNNPGGSIVNRFTFGTPENQSTRGITDLQWNWTKE